MQFHSDGSTYKVVSITGPTHNFLGVQFTPSDVFPEEVLVEPIQLRPTEPVRLTTEEVRHWTLEGIREANEELGLTYRPHRISFVVSDSRPAEIYRELARRIVLRMHARPAAFDGVEG